jgi:hypothetical protein
MCTVDGVIGREIKFRLQMPDAWNNKFAMGRQGNCGLVSFMAAQRTKRCSSAMRLPARTRAVADGAAADLGDGPLPRARRQVNFFRPPSIA